MLDYELSFDATFEALEATIAEHGELQTNKLFVHIISMEYESKTSAPERVNVLDPQADITNAAQHEGDELEDFLADEVAADLALEDMTPLRGGLTLEP